jgi:hypothetical protein
MIAGLVCHEWGMDDLLREPVPADHRFCQDALRII